MDYKKYKTESFWKGFKTDFDLYGIGFERKDPTNTIENSWRNVGTYFKRVFDFNTFYDNT